MFLKDQRITSMEKHSRKSLQLMTSHLELKKPKVSEGEKMGKEKDRGERHRKIKTG